MNHSAILAQDWEQCTTITIFFHNFYALLSSTVFHHCIVALLSAVLILSTVKPLNCKTEPYPILHIIMSIVAIGEARTECFVIAKNPSTIYKSILVYFYSKASILSFRFDEFI